MLLGGGVCFALTVMATLDLCWIPPQAPFPGISQRGKHFYCNSSCFTDNMLLDPSPQARGGNFWEHKWCQGSMVLFLCLKHHHQPDSDLHGEPHALSRVCWLRYFLLPHYLPYWAAPSLLPSSLFLPHQSKHLLSLVFSHLLAEP